MTWRILSQAAALFLLHEYVTQPRVAAGVGQFVSHLKTISAALQTMTVPQQQEFIGRIAEKEGIRISPVRGTERMRPAADVKAIDCTRSAWPISRPTRAEPSLFHSSTS